MTTSLSSDVPVGYFSWAEYDIMAPVQPKLKVPLQLLSFLIVTKPALPALGRLIHSNDEDVLTDACWALSYLSDGTNDKVQAVIEAGVCPRLVELLLYSSPSVLIPALRMVGNIVTGDDMQTQCIINHQALLCLLNPLTNNHNKSIKKEACWTISNITASNKEQIRAVIEANIIGPLVHLLQNAETTGMSIATAALVTSTATTAETALLIVALR
ncbi:hypothetical protein AAG906_006153 [Vitis piasezkii]